MNLVKLFVCLFILVLVLSGCGKYGPPLAPEALAPRTVENLTASASLGQVQIEWQAPREDRRGEELKSIEGYEIYRIELLADQPLPPYLALEELYEKIAFIPDSHIEERERLRREARAKNQPVRRVNVAPELLEFSFVDKELEGGRRYIYQIRPVNQGGVEGDFFDTVQVFYRGDMSEVLVGPGLQSEREQSDLQEGDQMQDVAPDSIE